MFIVERQRERVRKYRPAMAMWREGGQAWGEKRSRGGRVKSSQTFKAKQKLLDQF